MKIVTQHVGIAAHSAKSHVIKTRQSWLIVSIQDQGPYVFVLSGNSTYGVLKGLLAPGVEICRLLLVAPGFSRSFKRHD
jgi:hypothetical protein